MRTPALDSIARDVLDGPNNVQNTGTVHWGKGGAGGDPRCGNARAHMTFGKEDFRKFGESEQCARCAAILKRMDERKQS